ncbi:hypothetical protein BRYFOR_09413 [Marvinbryantia formatexigens DSM 14469]|uniref:Uncharacterized protein n=1 Tax=Marvinbryantia formatexigens DSM 14469 TaxID=478749 RepID=C6LL66_9FIRM|nr:hypothetical protein [Marvinbryantia formatexigens]EET58685.1 hypothetical protein BRYFOR_09413 [Marvinbryantia formatexigens DSM 14469]UWO23404.1 hypothetical protein NQ534_13190 [Marvinbryantia formatexigens DSM 14469]SDG38446.1 hypothetical protein SAMN05660368_02442 [Marvinbryantia formatexigens]
MKENETNGVGVRQLAERYKWIAFIIHCCTLYLLYAKEFFTFSSEIVAEFNDKLVRLLYGNTANSIGNGKLTLMQFHNFLVESINEGVVRDGDGGGEYIEIMSDVFYKAIVFCFFIALLELIMICVGEVAVADAINIIYALSVFFLVSFNLLWCYKFRSWDEGLDGKALSLSAWSFLWLILPVVTSALLNKCDKFLKAAQNMADEESSSEEAEISYTNVENSWTEYCRKNKSVLIITILILLLELIVYKGRPAVLYNETGIVVWKMVEAFLIGMSVVYAASGSLRFLGILAFLSACGSMLIYSENLWYFTWQIWVINIVHIALIEAILWIESKAVKKNPAGIYIMLCTAWVVAVPFYQSLSWGGIHMNFGIRTLCETIGLVFPVLLFVKNKTVFVKLFHIKDEKVSNFVCPERNILFRNLDVFAKKYREEKTVKICPTCGKIQNKPGKYCGFCGQLLEGQNKKL